MKYLKPTDEELAKILIAEEKRQAETLMMIPSVNYTSQAVLEVLGSCFQNKYCEGYPFKRYYQGQKYCDQLETICIQRCQKAFAVPYANVQPLSGVPANSAVYFALLNYGDVLMGMALDQGGHLSHGAEVSFSGKYFKSVFYHVDKKGFLDYDDLEKTALREKPKIIITGFTSYPRIPDFKKFRQVADEVGAYLMADMAHVAGLIVAGSYPNPAPYVDIITTTTHKTLRGPRGAIIMVTDRGLKKDPDLAKKIDRAVFPGLQGGPHMHTIAGIAVALKEAMKPSFKKYGQQIVKNAVILAKELNNLGFDLVSGSTDTHLLVIDLQQKKILGNTLAEALEEAGIVVNKQSVPYDPNPPFYPSGIRLGTPAITSRGMMEKEMTKIASWIREIVDDILQIKQRLNINSLEERKSELRQKIISRSKTIPGVARKVKKLSLNFPIKKLY